MAEKTAKSDHETVLVELSSILIKNSSKNVHESEFKESWREKSKEKRNNARLRREPKTSESDNKHHIEVQNSFFFNKKEFHITFPTNLVGFEPILINPDFKLN